MLSVDTNPDFHVLGVDGHQTPGLLGFVDESKALGAPHQTLMATTLVAKCKGALAWPLAEVGAEVEGGCDGWVRHDGGAMAIASHWDGARGTIKEVHLQLVIEPAHT